MPLADQNALSARRWWAGLQGCIVALAFASICAAMVLTVGDIVVRTTAQGVGAVVGERPKWGLYGLVDLTQLAMMAACPLAIAATFFAGKHIRVDLVFNALPPRLRRLALRFSALVGLGVMGICLWTAWREMRGQLDFTTTSATLGLAYTWYWVPLIAGLGLAVLGCVAHLIWPRATEDADV